MRLVCPNCDATYEVPDSVIPAEGRDVQCSNCGTAWFFDPNPRATAPEPDPVPPQAAQDAPPAQDYTPPPQPAPAPPTTGATQAEPATQAPPAPPERQPLETKVTEVLREEAAFEARARAEEAGLEYQDDLPLDAPPEPTPPEPDAEAVALATGTARRDLLPDIDEINSTLRSTSERKPAETTIEDAAHLALRRRQGFRTGFGLACLLLAAAAGLYSYAGQVSEQVPALGEHLDVYVAKVNEGRIWLEDAVNRLVDQMGT